MMEYADIIYRMHKRFYASLLQSSHFFHNLSVHSVDMYYYHTSKQWSDGEKKCDIIEEKLLEIPEYIRLMLVNQIIDKSNAKFQIYVGLNKIDTALWMTIAKEILE